MGTNTEILAKMRLTLDLAEAAEKIELQNLRRRHPDESPEQIEARFCDWLRRRRDVMPRSSAKRRPNGAHLSR